MIHLVVVDVVVDTGVVRSSGCVVVCDHLLHNTDRERGEREASSGGYTPCSCTLSRPSHWSLAPVPGL